MGHVLPRSPEQSGDADRSRVSPPWRIGATTAPRLTALIEDFFSDKTSAEVAALLDAPASPMAG